MLIATVSGFGAVDAELAQLQTRVADCFSRKQDDLARGRRGLNAVIASGCSNGVLDSLRRIETVTFIDKEDQALLFSLARTLLQQWRNMGADGGVDDKEADIRRIAAQKLTDHGFLAPEVAIQQLSSVGRIETDALVLLRIVNGLAQLITKDTSANIATEATNTIGIIAADPNPGVKIAAQAALATIKQKLKPQIVLEIGPATVEVLPSKASKLVPVIVIASTAAVSGVVLWAIFGRRRRGRR